ncbi:MAG: YqaJ viral recombinase family protein, partial [Lachnospiraceae bacterium]|nr:YqaJ viral recombinase family protein [Lachnospiraceae bacterium]
MKKIISTLNLPREEWLMYRKNGIGGSDAGAVAGVNPYASPMKVYYEKTAADTKAEEQDNEAMRQGRDLEEYVSRRFTEATGLKVRRANALFCDEARPYMIADVDRLVVGKMAGLECKTVSPYSESKWEDGNIPLHYQVQCYHYMSVLGLKEWYIAALIYGREFIVRKLTWQDGIIDGLRRIEENFWRNHVEPRIPPEPDGSEITDKVLAEYFRRATAGKSIELKGFADKFRRRSDLAARIEELKAEKSAIEQEVKLYLGDAESAE